MVCTSMSDIRWSMAHCKSGWKWLNSNPEIMDSNPEIMGSNQGCANWEVKRGRHNLLFNFGSLQNWTHLSGQEDRRVPTLTKAYYTLCVFLNDFWVFRFFGFFLDAKKAQKKLMESVHYTRKKKHENMKTQKPVLKTHSV